jgi:NAD(P)-dependent dehydrogenase (short-subunit alcohol dehydrogenase family)
MSNANPDTNSLEAAPIALVTGGARRIGAAIATCLASAGYRVVIHAHGHFDEAQKLADDLSSRGGHVRAVKADLTDPAARARLIADAASQFGPLSLLVNNASVFMSDRFADQDEAGWNANFEINLKAPVDLARAFAKQVPAGGNASIVNLVDHRVFKLTPQHFSYTLSKSALYTATLTMAQALAPHIRVNAIGPGPTFANPKDGAAGLSKEISGVPLGRAVVADDIAEAVLYLARATSVTGQMIAVDSGQHIGWRTPDITD